MQRCSLLLLIILGYLIFSLLIGKNGVLEYADIHADIKVQKAVNEKLQLRNDNMFSEIDDLRQGLDSIEERARNELGMIKKGETFYRIVDSNTGNYQ